jgi:phosphatidate cytidylyltransferase
MENFLPFDLLPDWIQAKPVVLLTFALIFLFLILASAITLILRKLRGGLEEVWIRIKTWWIMIAVLCAALTTNDLISTLFFAMVSFFALREFVSLVPTRRSDRLIIFLAFLIIPLQYWLVYLEWYGLFIVLIPVYAFLLFPALLVSTGQTDGFLKAAATIQWGLMTTIFSLSHAAYLLALPEAGNPRAGGAGLALYVLIITQLNDVLQFLWGKTFGRSPITPRVSPKKTWEGFLGGLATTIGVSYLLAPYLTPLTPVESLWIGAVLACAGFAGDVNMSAVKRDIRVKDTGSLLPGHGGMLDRVDSLTFTAPLWFHLVYWLHY